MKELALKCPAYEAVLDMITEHLPNPAEAQQYRVPVVWQGDAESGIGKSELALELISKGHHLVADDAITIRRTSPEHLEGYCDPKFNHFLEVRGLGILNIREMFGEAATRRTKRIELIVNLQRMDKKHLGSMDRLHQQQNTHEILGIQIPEITVPVTSGRNLSVMIEAAVRTQILVARGYNAVEDFISIQQDAINSNS